MQPSWLSGPGCQTACKVACRYTAFAASLPDLLSQTLDSRGLHGRPPARPAWAASYSVLVHQVVALLHTSFRPHLAVTPLCFAIPSSLSDWEEDFHLQAVEHARHTDRIAHLLQL